MILVDTSTWIDYLRKGDEILVSLLNSSQVLGMRQKLKYQDV